jgi:hypothetical protein
MRTQMELTSITRVTSSNSSLTIMNQRGGIRLRAITTTKGSISRITAEARTTERMDTRKRTSNILVKRLLLSRMVEPSTGINSATVVRIWSKIRILIMTRVKRRSILLLLRSQRIN